MQFHTGPVCEETVDFGVTQYVVLTRAGACPTDIVIYHLNVNPALPNPLSGINACEVDHEWVRQ